MLYSCVLSSLHSKAMSAARHGAVVLQTQAALIELSRTPLRPRPPMKSFNDVNVGTSMSATTSNANNNNKTTIKIIQHLMIALLLFFATCCLCIIPVVQDVEPRAAVATDILRVDGQFFQNTPTIRFFVLFCLVWLVLKRISTVL